MIVTAVGLTWGKAQHPANDRGRWRQIAPPDQAISLGGYTHPHPRWHSKMYFYEVAFQLRSRGSCVLCWAERHCSNKRYCLCHAHFCPGRVSSCISHYPPLPGVSYRKGLNLSQRTSAHDAMLLPAVHDNELRAALLGTGSRWVVNFRFERS